MGHTRAATAYEVANFPIRRGSSNDFTLYVEVPGVPLKEQPFVGIAVTAEIAEALVERLNGQRSTGEPPAGTRLGSVPPRPKDGDDVRLVNRPDLRSRRHGL